MKWVDISTFGDLLNGSYNAVFYDVNTRPIDISLIELDRAIQTIRTTKQHMVLLSDGIELKTSFRALLETYMKSQGLVHWSLSPYVHYVGWKPEQAQAHQKRAKKSYLISCVKAQTVSQKWTTNGSGKTLESM